MAVGTSKNIMDMSAGSIALTPDVNETAVTPPPPATMTVVTYENNFDVVTVAILSGLLVFLSVVVIAILTKILRDRVRDSNREAEATGETPDSSDTEERIIRRYETVEHWLITKRVQKHDEFCSRVVGCIIPHSPVGTDGGEIDLEGDVVQRVKNPEATCACYGADCAMHSSAHTGDDSLFDEDNECPICMNDLRLGDIVSWSASKNCKHVYHHECIKEWLLRRTGCPFCRETFLPCDEIRGDKRTEELKEMSKRYASRSTTTYYCMQDGLVALPPMVRCTLKELELLKSRIFDSSLKPENLVALRGERKEVTATAISTKDAELGLTVEDASENPCIGDDILVEYSPDKTLACVTFSSSPNPEDAAADTSLEIRHGTPEGDEDEDSSSAAIVEAFGGELPGDDDLLGEETTEEDR